MSVPPSPLSIDAIRGTLSTKWLGRRIELRRQVGSTNREATELLRSGVEDGTVVVADSQTEGRGRLSRHWFSPPGLNLYCSIVIRKRIAPERFSEWLSWLPLSTALAAAEAIETVAATGIAVKWPNDLLLGDRKVGGILCESGTTAGNGQYQVIGIGLNVNGTTEDFPQDLQGIATSLRQQTGHPIDRNRLLAQLLMELEGCIEELESGTIEKIAFAYQCRCSTIGKTVKAMLTDGTEFTGAAESIDHDGSLKVIHRPLPSSGGPPRVLHLRAADIVHLRI